MQQLLHRNRGVQVLGAAVVPVPPERLGNVVDQRLGDLLGGATGPAVAVGAAGTPTPLNGWPRPASLGCRPARRPNAAPPTGTTRAGPNTWTSPSCPSAPRPSWPGCCWPCRSWSLWTYRPGRRRRLPRHRRHSRGQLPAGPARLETDRDPAGLPRRRPAADPAAALFAGLSALPKTTALSSYSDRLDHTRQRALLTALGTAMLDANLITDADDDLDLSPGVCAGSGAGGTRTHDRGIMSPVL